MFGEGSSGVLGRGARLRRVGMEVRIRWSMVARRRTMGEQHETGRSEERARTSSEVLYCPLSILKFVFAIFFAFNDFILFVNIYDAKNIGGMTIKKSL